MRSSTGVRRNRHRAGQGRSVCPPPGPAAAGCATTMDPAGGDPPRRPARGGTSEGEGARGGAKDGGEGPPEAVGDAPITKAMPEAETLARVWDLGER